MDGPNERCHKTKCQNERCIEIVCKESAQTKSSRVILFVFYVCIYLSIIVIIVIISIIIIIDYFLLSIMIATLL